jgi:hypothetical protein
LLLSLKQSFFLLDFEKTSQEVLKVPKAPSPRWSPDGRTITVPVKHFGEPERWVLHAVSVADGHVRELYSSPTGIGRPVWLLHGSSFNHNEFLTAIGWYPASPFPLNG